MRPPITYYGGKTLLAHRLVAMMPAHTTYIEPFFGSGAVFFAKPQARNEIVNDADDLVANFFQVLRDHTDALLEACALSPHSRTEYERCAGVDPTGLEPIEKARVFWVRVNQSFAKTAGDRTGWSCTTARSQSVPGSIAGRLGRFAQAAERLMATTIECCDAADLIDRLATPDTVVYADPPYLGSTRAMRRSSDYRTDMMDDESHVRLAQVLTDTPATVLLSGYQSDLYEDLYEGWWSHTIDTSIRSSNAIAGSRGRRQEVIWSNRPIREQMGLLA